MTTTQLVWVHALSSEIQKSTQLCIAVTCSDPQPQEACRNFGGYTSANVLDKRQGWYITEDRSREGTQCGLSYIWESFSLFFIYNIPTSTQINFSYIYKIYHQKFLLASCRLHLRISRQHWNTRVSLPCMVACISNNIASTITLWRKGGWNCESNLHCILTT